MLIAAAAAAMEGSGERMHRRQQRHHASADRPHRDLRPSGRRGGAPDAARRDHAQGSQGLDHRRQAAATSRHRRQADRQAEIRHRPGAAEHAERGGARLSGVRRQARELRCRRRREDARRAQGCAGRRHRRRRRRRHLVARQDRDRCLAHHLGRGAERQCSSSTAIADMLAEGLEAKDAFVGNSVGDAPAVLAGAGQVITADLRLSVSESRHDGADERARALHAERCEVWVPTQNAEASLAAAAEAAGLPIGQCDVHKVHLGGGFGRRGDCRTTCARPCRSPSRCPARRSS